MSGRCVMRRGNSFHAKKKTDAMNPLRRDLIVVLAVLIVLTTFMFTGCIREQDGVVDGGQTSLEPSGSDGGDGGQTSSDPSGSDGSDGGQTSPESLPTFTPETYPRIDGSTVTIPLSEAVAARLMNMTVEEARPYILHNKTHQAYVNLIENKADLIFVTYPSAEEFALAKSAGVVLDIIPVVSEAFVFLVNAENSAAGLTPAELQKIYTGEITSWSEVGGTNLDIIPYQRPLNSGSQTGFLDMVMAGLTPMAPPMEQVIAEMGMLIDAVASYENGQGALGYSYYYFVMDMWGAENIKLLEIDGVAPTPETITAGTYPFTTAYYAVTRHDEPEDSPARQVIDWLLSSEGQTLAEDTGYVRIK